jgi:hypothetical protein
MMQVEFKGEIGKLLAAFPTFRPEDKKNFLETWWEALRPFETAEFREARKVVTEGIHEFFPALGLVLDQCRRATERLRAARKKGNLIVRFGPEPHDCAVNHSTGRIVKLSGARKLLSLIEPFEAIHVECRGQPNPICPNCGAKQRPMVHEFIEGLMKQFPEETQGWNPYHKSTLLCPRCASQFDSESSPVPEYAEAVTVP